MLLSSIEALKVMIGAVSALSLKFFECNGYILAPSATGISWRGPHPCPRQLWSLSSLRGLLRPWKESSVAFWLLVCLGVGLLLLPLASAGHRGEAARCAITPDSNGLVTIPAFWTSIEFMAFIECPSLTSVVFEKGSQLQSIDDFAFAYLVSGLSGTLTIPASVTSIGSDAFACEPYYDDNPNSDCSSSSFTVVFESGSQLQSIGGGAFAHSGLSGTLTIPASVTYVGNKPFQACPLFTTLVFESGYQDQQIYIAGDLFSNSGEDVDVFCSCAGNACPAEYFSLVPICVGCAAGEKYSSEKSACLQCPMKEACLDGHSCAANYEGAGCATCSQGYFVLNEACNKCPDTHIAVLLTLGLVFTAVFGVGIYYLSGKLINLAGLSTISIGHFQSITVFMSISFPIPEVFYDIARKIQAVFAFMYIDLFFSPDCVSKSSFTFYEKWRLLTFIPIGLLLALYVWEGHRCRPSGPYLVSVNETSMADGNSQLRAIEMIERGSEQALLESESGDQPLPAASGTELDESAGGASRSGAPDTPSVASTERIAATTTATEDSKKGPRRDAHDTEADEMGAVPSSTADKAAAVQESSEEQEQNMSCLQRCCCCFYYCCSKVCVPEFGRMVNLGIVVFYIFILSQSFKLFNCSKVDHGYFNAFDPSVSCLNFDIDRLDEWFAHAILAIIVLLVCTYMPYKLYDNLRYELFSSEHSKLEHGKNMGFLYQKYKPEYWYWEPVVEMSRKWFLVFFSTFMPTGESQVAMDITITVLYWGLHAWCLPYRIDWKDADGNPADPDLENNLQHYMYAIQIFLLVTMSAHSSYSNNPDIGGAILLFFYFLGVVFLVYSIYKITMRQRRRNELVPAEDAHVEAGQLSKTTQALKKIFDGMGGQ